MLNKSNPSTRALVTYASLVGQILASKRSRQGIRQGAVARELGISQSAFSRLEAGDSVINIGQLRDVCACLRIAPAEILREADMVAGALSASGAEVVSTKSDNAAAIAIGLGLLAAVLLGSR